MAQDTDLAYAAGIIDGDGCIAVTKERRYDRPHPYYFRVNIRVSQTDLEALLWLKETFGGSLYIGNYARGNRKECWVWSLRARGVSISFLEGILPYLKIKKQQAEMCLKFFALVVNHRPVLRISKMERQVQEILANKISELNTCHKVPEGGK